MRRLQLERFMGRWGNQCIQYAIARACAERLGCTLETPSWAGRLVFDIADPLITSRLPGLKPEELPDRPNVACHGFWQFQEAFDLLSRAKVRQWFRLYDDVLEHYPKQRPFYIACHVRRGDYVKHQDKLAVVERVCFERAVQDRGYRLEDVIWLTEENPQPGNGEWPKQLSFMPDFLTIMQADVVFRSNSTFSQWAAWLGPDDQRHFSPLVGDKVGIREDIEFIEGNHAANLSVKYHPGVPHSEMRMKP